MAQEAAAQQAKDAKENAPSSSSSSQSDSSGSSDSDSDSGRDKKVDLTKRGMHGAECGRMP